jgi:hypothetical protein
MSKRSKGLLFDDWEIFASIPAFVTLTEEQNE